MAKPRIDPNDLGKRTGSCPDPVWAYCGRARMEVARGTCALSHGAVRPHFPHTQTSLSLVVVIDNTEIVSHV